MKSSTVSYCDICGRLRPAVLRYEGYNCCPGCLTSSQQADNELRSLPPEDIQEIREVQRLAREAEEREAAGVNPSIRDSNPS
jgi:hypothetical protein